jgi:small subunit ribosomal protein S4
MGKPKFSRKKYDTPSHPWKENRIKSENELIKKYGLKNKREVWKAETRLRKYRGQARELLAKIGTSDAQSKKESDQLLMHLNRMNLLPPNSTLDDVLTLETESILSRRLQTLTYLKGLANTPDQARQLISHGHVAIGNRRVTIPSYLITREEETEIGYTSDSPLNDLMHPARPKADYKSRPIKKEEKEPEGKPKEPVQEKNKPEEKKDEKPEQKEEKPKETIKQEKTPTLEKDKTEEQKQEIKKEEKSIETETKTEEKKDIKKEETSENKESEVPKKEETMKVEKKVENKKETEEKPGKEDKKEED